MPECPAVLHNREMVLGKLMKARHPRHGYLIVIGNVQPVKLVEEWQTIQAYLRADTLAVEEAAHLHDERNADQPPIPMPCTQELDPSYHDVISSPRTAA